MARPFSFLRCLMAVMLWCRFCASAFVRPSARHTRILVVSTPLNRPSINFSSSGSSLDRVPLAVRRQRRSIGVIQTMGLFGLGAPEIAIILVAVAFVLGPDKLGELGKGAGKVAGELKEVPKEFQSEFRKGLEEGETEARSRKAKPMKAIPPEIGPGGEGDS